MADTPAAEAGLEEGDVVTEVDGQRVTDGIALIVAIRTYQPGDTIDFTLTRDGAEQTVEVTLGGETGCRGRRPAQTRRIRPRRRRGPPPSTNGWSSTNVRVSSYMRWM